MSFGSDAAPLAAAQQRHYELLGALNQQTPGGYAKARPNSTLKQANLDNVDWRVPALMRCKDPSWSESRPLDPRVSYEMRERLRVEGDQLERTLATEAMGNEQRMRQSGWEPKEYYYTKQSVPFNEAVPYYKRQDDIWERKLSLRTADEALRGNLYQPMPKPVVFAEDYENFQQGRHIKDDCYIT
eukprot:gnl/TRDRNA2_/TRDRNA2_182585_c0_seq1.p1 gnl/TRDRNA2_/TRDRNA2_182585_c0~~gnl/TRDRNA2_/TRDRNA2_182585_c0_seq1.p1  ORF type:complete len:185 (+),score=35.21 gnl/TRDRNA2_/TRDRNA2_182585_c0_seq1:56-610(+)